MEVEQGVEEHAELAEVLPAPDGVGGEEKSFAFADRSEDDGGAAFDLVGAVEETAEDGLFAAGEAHEDGLLVEGCVHAEERAVGVADGDGFVCVAVEDGAGGLGDFGFDDGAGGVDLGGGGGGVDFRSDAEIGGHEAGGAEGDEEAALLGEFLDFGDAGDAHAAGDVVGGAVVAEEFELVGLGVGDGGLGFGDVGDEGLGGTHLVGDEEDVIVGVEVAFEDTLFEYEVVGNVVLVEGEADPADVLCAGPGAEHGDAREASGMSGDGGLGGEGDDVEAEIGGDGLELVECRRGDEEGAGGEGGGDGCFGDGDGDVFEFVGEGRNGG